MAKREAGEAALELHDAIRSIVRWAGRSDAQGRAAAIEGVRVTSVDTWLLSAIDGQGPMRASELAQRRGVDNSTVTPQLRRLEDAGLLKRSIDPTDRRAALLTLTAKGRRILQKSRTSGALALEAELQSWSGRDRRDLARLLARLASTLDPQPDTAPPAS